MTDDRSEPPGAMMGPVARNREDVPSPMPPTRPPPPGRRTPWGWIVAALLALVLAVLVSMYFMGLFDGERRREEVPWNSGYAEPDPARSAPSVAWLTGTWGPLCPDARQRAVTFASEGRFSGADGSGSWSLAGDVVTVIVNGRSHATRWERVVPDGAWVAQVDTGEVRYVRRCP
jgi:hypothetical protein